MPKSVLPFLFLIFAGAALCAQSNTMLDELLSQESAGFGHAAYLVLTASGHLPESGSATNAVSVAAENGWMKKEKSADTEILLGEYAFLLMEAFDLSGGIMYRIIPGPRYAAREVYFLGLVPKPFSAYKGITGEEAVRYLGNTLRYMEEK